MVSQSETTAPKPDKHFVDATQGYSGCVMVVSAPHGMYYEVHIRVEKNSRHPYNFASLLETRSAIWGGLMTVRAQVNGVQGVVLSGRCRDLQEQWDSGFPVRDPTLVQYQSILC